MLSFSLLKQFETFSLDVSLSIENEIVVLLAPSGGGKTLTLNLISGIVTPDSGIIRLNGTELYNSSRKISLPIRKRGIGYIFQDYALFPNKTVRENIAFGMPKGDHSKSDLTALLQRFNLGDKTDAYPHQLSGGQRQRAAIARALAAKSRVLLFDEPLSALDAHLRESLLKEIREIPKLFSLPVLYVTHNFCEAEEIADRIAVMQNGKIVEVGDVSRIFRKPHRLFTAKFIGVKNLFPCTVDTESDVNWKVTVSDSFTFDIKPVEQFKTVTSAWLGIHPKDIRLIVTDEGRPNTLNVHVASMQIIERVYRVELQVLNHAESSDIVPDFTLYMDIEELTCKKYRLQLNDVVKVSLRPDRMFLCD